MTAKKKTSKNGPVNNDGKKGPGDPTPHKSYDFTIIVKTFK